MSTFTVGVVVLAHREPQQLTRTLTVLNHHRIRLYVHVDRAAPLGGFESDLASIPSRIRWLPRRRTPWGSLGLVDATLDGVAAARADGCRYVLLISGEDVPLRPASDIVDFAAAAGERSFVEHWPLPTCRWPYDGRARTDFYTYSVFGRRETCIPAGIDTSHLSARGRLLNTMLRVPTSVRPQRHFPEYLRAFGGSQWINLSAIAADTVLAFVAAHPDYHRYHKHTQIPDELFVQSIILGSEAGAACPVVNNDLRFADWPHDESHPRCLTLDDLPALEAASDLFARKIRRSQQPELFDILLARLAE